MQPKAKQPTIDLILTVENSRQFHEENLAKNKHHYTYFVRSTKGFIVHKIQDAAARMHFNQLTLEENEFVKEISDGEQTSLKIRYGVISTEDMLRDLEHWETLLTSSFL